ncbi:MAG: MBL fold metallo-hydrolase [Phycisphaerae bacterium]
MNDRQLATIVMGIVTCVTFACSKPEATAPSGPFVWTPAQAVESQTMRPHVTVLGIAQDAGYPQADCRKECCKPAWRDASKSVPVACLGLTVPRESACWLLDATPDFPRQHHTLTHPGHGRSYVLRGIFLTHAHMGHYAGLIHLGREAMGAQQVPVYAMPRMRSFLTQHGPWEQLVKIGNVRLAPLEQRETITLTRQVSVTPLLVPHRDEYSETVGFIIAGPNAKVLFIPDIDKWERWNDSIEEFIQQVDIAYLDGTFFADGEIEGRSMDEIPHPFMMESMARFKELPLRERQKIRFIHLNHTNPALHENSIERQRIRAAGFDVAKVGEVVPL